MAEGRVSQQMHRLLRRGMAILGALRVTRYRHLSALSGTPSMPFGELAGLDNAGSTRTCGRHDRWMRGWWGSPRRCLAEQQRAITTVEHHGC